MSNDNMQEKMQEILSNENNLKTIVAATKKSDVDAIFAEKGITLTDEQFDKIKNLFNKLKKGIQSLSKEELKSINGGNSVTIKLPNVNISDTMKRDIKIGTGTGALTGMFAAAIGGSIYGIIDTADNCKKGDGFFKTFCTALKKITISTLVGGLSGAIIGTAGGAAAGLVDENTPNSWTY